MSTATMDPPQAEEQPAEEAQLFDDTPTLEVGQALGFTVGGKEPTSAHLTLTGGQIKVIGQFEKGQRIALRLEAVVDFVGFKDERDTKTRQVIGCKRKQEARIEAVHLLEVAD